MKKPLRHKSFTYQDASSHFDNIDLSQLFSRMISENILFSVDNTYRINIRKASGDYIQFDVLDSLFRKHFTDQPKFTASNALDKLSNRSRPNKTEWYNFIDDLVSDGYLTKVESNSKIHYFKVAN